MKSFLTLLAIVLTGGAAVLSVLAGNDAASTSRQFLGMDRWLVLGLLPLLLMLLHAGFGGWIRRDSATQTAALADELHLIGFFATLSAFGAVVAAYGFGSSVMANGTTIMRAGAVAITSTLLGLVLMAMMRTRSGAMRKGDQATINDGLSALDDDIKSTRDDVQATGRGCRAMKKELDGLVSAFTKIAKPLKSAVADIERFAKGADSLQGALRALSLVEIDPESIGRLEKALGSLAALEAPLASAKTSAESMGATFESVTGAAGAMGESLSAAAANTDAINVCMTETGQVHDDFVRLLARYVSGMTSPPDPGRNGRARREASRLAPDSHRNGAKGVEA